MTKEKKVKIVLLSLRKKKSSEKDGISQEQIIWALVIPLTRATNTSILTGEVLEEGKEAVVNPILKKGDSQKSKKFDCS